MCPLSRLVLVVTLLSGTTARAADDPFGVWAPADGGAVTAAVAARIPEDGAVCIEQAVTRASRAVSFEIDQLTSGATMELDRYQEPFALCMAEKGWHRVDANELTALRVQGELEDCAAKRQASCAGAITQYVHGVADAELEASKGMDVAGQLCDAGDTLVCLTAASLALRPPEGRGLEPNGRVALSFGTRGCEKGNAESCGFVGALLSTGAAGVAQDTGRGAKYLARACAAGESSACNWPNGGKIVSVDASIPAASAWCKYGAPTTNGQGCGGAPVAWLAGPQASACAPTLTVSVGSCIYSFRLGQ